MHELPDLTEYVVNERLRGVNGLQRLTNEFEICVSREFSLFRTKEVEPNHGLVEHPLPRGSRALWRSRYWRCWLVCERRLHAFIDGR